MHEMSIAISILKMAEEEAAKAGCNKVISVSVEYGQLTGIMPEALEAAFEACIRNTLHEGAELVLKRIPLKMRCIFCGCVFGCEETNTNVIPCPQCKDIFGHIVEQGKELVLARVEAIKQP